MKITFVKIIKNQIEKQQLLKNNQINMAKKPQMC